jgi:AcrR family transcriptional regulator
MKRKDRQLQTRARLLDAAAHVFARRGFGGASLEEIARVAGCTTGAVYSNFTGKEDLFLALLDRTTDRHVAAYEVLDDASGPASRGSAFIAFLDRDPEAWTLFMEFWVHAMRDETLRPQLARGHAALRTAIARMLAGSAMPIDDDEAVWLATVIQALGSGLALIRLLDSADVPDDMFDRALDLLYRGRSPSAHEAS